MYSVRIEHAVQNYEGWKKSFDSDPIGREKMGVRAYRVLRLVENPNHVLIDLEFDTRSEADSALVALHGATPGAPARKNGSRLSPPPAGGGLIAEIARDTIWRGRDSGTVWFHPRACLIQGKEPRLLMTLQSISGSDVFGPVHWTESDDVGRTWSDPRPIPGFGRTLHADGIEEGICDVVEVIPKNYRGDTLIARVRWSRPNHLLGK